MQVRGLPRQIIRTGRAASRLLAAQTPDIEAARRRDAVARWRRAMSDGLTAEQAAQAVGAPRSTLYRWEKQPELRSRRPRRVRQPKGAAALVEAVEAVRADNPMWGKRKIAALLKREGQAVSVSKVGRILRRLMGRGVVVPVPILRRKPGGRRFRFDGRQRYAQRLAKGRKAHAPGDLVQIDTLFVNLRPDRAIKHFTAYDPVAKWTVGHVATAASASAAKDRLDKLLAGAPFKIKDIQVDSGSEFMSIFENHCRDKRLELVVLPPKRPDLNGCVERAQSSWRYEFYASYDLPARIDRLQPASRPSPIDTTTTDLTRPSAIALQPGISETSAQRPRRLICAEPAHVLAIVASQH
jgi:putative transposase